MSSDSTVPGRQFRGRLARTMLLILLLLSVGPLLLMGGMAYWRARTLLRDQVFTQMASVASVQGERLIDEIETGELLLERAAAGVNVTVALRTVFSTDNPKETSYIFARQLVFNELQAINVPQPFYNRFLVVANDGTILLSSYKPWEGQKLPSSAFATTSEHKPLSRAVYGLEPFYPDTFTILTSVPFLDQKGSLVATIVGIAETPTVRDLMDKAKFFSKSHYFITADGKIVGANPYPNSFNKLTLVDPPAEYKTAVLNDFNKTKKSGVRELTSTQSQPVIAAYVWLADLDVGWIAEIPQAQVYGELNSLLVFAVLLFVGTFVLMGLMIWLTTRRLVKPILSLTEIVQHFAAGHWDYRAPVVQNNEIGLLSHSFNYMADELTSLYHSLETKVKERTSQIQAAAEISQIAAQSTSLDELLDKTVTQITERFSYANAAVFLIETGEAGPQADAAVGNPYAILSHSAGQEPPIRRIKIDSESLIGRVAKTNQAEETFTSASGPGENTAAVEAGVPIALGDHVLGVLRVCAERDVPLGQDALSGLKTLANLIAPALMNFNLLESTQINLQETSLLYQAAHQIAQAEQVESIFHVAENALQKTPYVSAFLTPEGEGMRVRPLSLIHAKIASSTEAGLVLSWVHVSAVELEARLATTAPIVIDDFQQSRLLPETLLDLPRRLGCDTVAFLPVLRAGRLAALLMLGANTQEQPGQNLFKALTLQPYTNLAELVVTTVEKVQALEDTQTRLRDLQTLYQLSQTISVETQLDSLYQAIHKQIDLTLGEVSFLIALYDSTSQMIEIPYLYEDGQQMNIEPFPLGEGLTSILIQTGKPLLIDENVEQRAQELGAKSYGAEVKSWLGVPMMIGGEVTGAMILQDTQREHRFNQDHARLLGTLATQVAVVIRNARLLENTRRQADRERMLNEITAKIRRTTDLHAILETTAEALGAALKARRATIELSVTNEPVPDPDQATNSRAASSHSEVPA